MAGSGAHARPARRSVAHSGHTSFVINSFRGLQGARRVRCSRRVFVAHLPNRTVHRLRILSEHQPPCSGDPAAPGFPCHHPLHYHRRPCGKVNTVTADELPLIRANNNFVAQDYCTESISTKNIPAAEP